MRASQFRRPPRRPGPEFPRGEILLEAPPQIPQASDGNFGQMLMYLPMVLGAGAMVFMFAGTGGTVITYVASSLYALSSAGMMFGMMGRTTGDRRRMLAGERKDYLRYLTQVRRRTRVAAARQRAALGWHHPDPDALWSLAMSQRLWERRAEDGDFAVARIGTGPHRLAIALIPPDASPMEDLDPVSVNALRSLIRIHSTVPDLPVSIAACSYARIGLSGDGAATRGLIRALICQLAVFHSPDDLRIAACVSRVRLPEWSWLKWLPHALDPAAQDGAGSVRLIRDDLGELEDLLGSDLADRPRFGSGPEPGTTHPRLLVIYDGGYVPPEAQLAQGDAYAVTVIDLTATLGRNADRHLLRLTVKPDHMTMLNVSEAGSQKETPLGRPDQLGVEQAEALARIMLPVRARTGPVSTRPAFTSSELPALLGVTDVAAFDPSELSQLRAPRDRLRIAIGSRADGSAVELDLKESAQGGMGPHGLIVGATGSGKSELLRTLVLGLAMTHSSETLNFALIDFKGGATFVGMEQLPHTSAVITNLSEELPLVDRMQDALRGELVRRQELLRSAGNYTSVHDYERARQQGIPLAPLPTLLVIVDEFSELLASRPEFVELFVMIGRLGRSLAVHLVLASQRLEEGRLRGLETHLSYRICLRTFSPMESRVVLGVPDAYELPAEPGSAYLKYDVTGMTRFKAAYVSGAYRQPIGPQQQQQPAMTEIVFYSTDHISADVPSPNVPEPALSGEPEVNVGPRVLNVIIDNLKDKGLEAHSIWLPPLGDPVTLDQISFHPGTLDSVLRATIGIVDRPFEQRRDPLIADLSGAGGHVAIVGATQTGKSTLLRTLVMSLALTHAPDQAHFYCLDFGGGTLASLSGLPHVGGVCGRTASDTVRRTVAELATLLDEREALFAAEDIDSVAAFRNGAGTTGRRADIFLVVDGWAILRQDFEALEQPITRLATRGLGYGIHVIIAANRWAEIRPQLKELLATRFELRLGEPMESEVNRHLAANVPETAGRGLTRDGFHFLAALPRADGLADASGLGDAVRDLAESVAASWPDSKAPPIRLLPSAYPYASLLELGANDAGPSPVTFGIAEADLGPVSIDFEHDQHFLVLGDSASGKSNLLRVLADGIVRRFTPQQARIMFVDYRRSLLEAVPAEYQVGYAPSAAVAAKLITDAAEAMRQRLPGPDVTPAQLRNHDWWHGPDLYLLIDDYDLVATATGSPVAPLLEFLPHSRDIGLHVVLARASGGASRGMFEPVMQRLRDLAAAGILLSGNKDEGRLLGNEFMRSQPPGRGTLITRSHPPQLVQVALMPSVR